MRWCETAGKSVRDRVVIHVSKGLRALLAYRRSYP
jgi:hypothetical protein